jgi:hypothetical protein
MAGLPTEMVVPAIEKAEGFGVIVRPTITNACLAAGLGVGVGSEKVLLPRMRAPDGPTLMTVPSMICAGPPEEMFAFLRVKSVGSAVAV